MRNLRADVQGGPCALRVGRGLRLVVPVATALAAAFTLAGLLVAQRPAAARAVEEERVILPGVTDVSRLSEADRRQALDQVVARSVSRRLVTEGTLGFDVDFEVRAGLIRDRFTGHVEKTRDQTVITTQGAPWFVPEEITSTLVEIETLVRDYELTLEGVEDTGRLGRLFVIGAVRKPGVSVGARKGRIWIQEHYWDPTRIELEYWWGRVAVDFHWGVYGDRRVVLAQTLAVEPISIRLYLSYKNFRFSEASASPSSPSELSRGSEPGEGATVLSSGSNSGAAAGQR